MVKGAVSYAVYAGLLFVLTVASGFWMAKAGRPYNGLLFNAHKLIALAGVVLAVLALIGAARSGMLTPVITAAAVITGISVIALFATGAMLSIIKEPVKLIYVIHNVSFVLITLSAAAVLAAFALKK